MAIKGIIARSNFAKVLVKVYNLGEIWVAAEIQHRGGGATEIVSH